MCLDYVIIYRNDQAVSSKIGKQLPRFPSIIYNVLFILHLHSFVLIRMF